MTGQHPGRRTTFIPVSSALADVVSAVPPVAGFPAESSEPDAVDVGTGGIAAWMSATPPPRSARVHLSRPNPAPAVTR